MKISSFRLSIIVAMVLGSLLVSQVQAGLAFRTTFNDDFHVGVGGTYEADGTLGVGDYIWLTTGSGDLATVEGMGGGGNKAVQFTENDDILAVRRWVAPVDQFDDVDLTQVASGMSFGYWVMADVTSGTPMLLLATKSGDLPNNNDNITHGLRHNTGATPYTSRRMAMERYGTASAATEFTAGVWHHLVFTYSAGAPGSVEKEMYIDGASVYTSTADHTIVLFTSGAHRIGGFWSSPTYVEHFEGKLDQFDVWDHDLSDAEVLAEYNAGPVVGEFVDPNAPWLRLTFNLDGGGLVANDGGSSDYYGALNNIDLVSSPGTRAASFTDPNSVSYVDIKNDNTGYLPSNMANNGLSMAYWVKFNEVGDAGNAMSYLSLLTTGTNGTNMPDSIQHSLKYPAVFNQPYSSRRFYDYGWTSSTEYPTDTWHHVVYTYEAIISGEPNMYLNVYVNGSSIATNVNRGPLVTDDYSAYLGILNNSGFKEHYDGQIDQFEIWIKTLDSTDVTNLYNAGPEELIPVDCAEAIAFGFNLSWDIAGDDCTVDMLDVGALFQVWLKCVEPGISNCDTPWVP